MNLALGMRSVFLGVVFQLHLFNVCFYLFIGCFSYQWIKSSLHFEKSKHNTMPAARLSNVCKSSWHQCILSKGIHFFFSLSLSESIDLSLASSTAWRLLEGFNTDANHCSFPSAGDNELQPGLYFIHFLQCRLYQDTLRPPKNIYHIVTTKFEQLGRPFIFLVKKKKNIP